MANVELPNEDRRDDGETDVVLPGADVDGSQEFIDDATGASFDEQAERAQAVIDRAHEMEHPELQPDDASDAARAEASGVDADERPA